MRHRLWSRALGALVAAALLGAAGGVSDLDAFLFHQDGRSSAAGVPHAERAADAGCHAERCVLALALANHGVASPPWAPAHGSGVPHRAAGPAPAAAPQRPQPHREPQPRAPPPLA